ncbi:MAG: GNAT family N-acetyltransferase [Eubacteriales bacterium]|nr:GNAT family N-acetyltransferase [Eubacteriales bacterium]MDD4475395.1 GNAT family N-acetyltransferase [Eubacteriales bacterium]
MDYNQITKMYYSKWLGINKTLCDVDGIEFIYSPERNLTQFGYSQPFDIYCFYQTNRIIVSYGEKAKEKIEIFKGKLNSHTSVDELKKEIIDVYGVIPHHNIKFFFNSLPRENKIARTLTLDDYNPYRDFFKKCNPSCGNTDWVQDYFCEMISDRVCVGVFVEGMIVSCTDSPGMPYMQDQVQEIGVNTLSDYRGKGYASAACILCAKNIIDNGKCPLWSTDTNNTVSERLAYKVGFIRFADVLTITI